MKKAIYAAASLALFAACGGDDAGGPSNELITTVVLTFKPATSPLIVATFNDPDGDGGQAPTVDPINIPPGNYTLTVQFQNRLSQPTEEITDEVRDEQNFHLLLFTGTAVVGPASMSTSGPLMQSYSDMDGNGLPVGLTNMIVASSGTGQLTVTLRHMPPEEPPVKSSSTLMDAKTNGVDSIGGSTDAQVTFPVTVP
jgi:hypothetical protein